MFDALYIRCKISVFDTLYCQLRVPGELRRPARRGARERRLAHVGNAQAERHLQARGGVRGSPPGFE